MPPTPTNAFNAYLVDKADSSDVAHWLEDGSPVSYGALVGQVSQATHLLSDAVAPRGRVMIALHDSQEFVTALWATLAIGSVAVPVDPDGSEDQLGHILDDCQPDVLVGDGDSPVVQRLAGGRGVQLMDGGELSPGSQPSRRALVHTGDPSRPALMQYTSGTTGRPKGVVHSHRGLVAVLEGFPALLGLRREDVVFSSAKVSFGYGFGNSILFPAAAGASSILTSKRVGPLDLVPFLDRFGCSVLCSGPRMYKGLLQRSVELPRSLRLAVSAGEALPRAVSVAWAEAGGAPLLDGLGLTEALHIVVANDGSIEHAGTLGSPVPGVELNVVSDTTGRASGAGEPGESGDAGELGELAVRSDQVGLGYWRADRPGTWRSFCDGAGWLRTGDVVRRRDSEITFLGRRDQVVKIAGVKVSAPVVEAELAELDGVLEAAVVPVLDGDGFSQLVAFVVVAGGIEPADVRRRYAQVAPAHNVPRRINLTEELPRTSTGKLDRNALRRSAVA